MKSENRSVYITVMVLTLIFFSFNHSVFAQSSSVNAEVPLYFYGPVIDAEDVSKIQLSTDLFYSQFQLENDFLIVDKRSTIFNLDILETHKGSSDVLFYNEIKETDGEWYVSLFLIDFAQGKEVSVRYIYDEYYRVLLDAKDSLAELLQKYSSTNGEGESYAQNIDVPDNALTVSMSNLFGTWQGEEFIDKIVILRGGRGFVIFENGASMNISINVEGSSFTAKQDSKSNASFFPELPREIALVKAIDAEPIKWELTIESENSMVGVKHTYTSEQNNFIATEVPVKWYR